MKIYGLDFISVIIAIFILGYFGYKQQNIFFEISIKTAKNSFKEKAIRIPKKEAGKKYNKSGLKNSESNFYAKKILDYIEKEKPYYDNKLSLKQLARLLELSTNHLSQIINENFNRNFYDLINEYRVKEVKKCLSNQKYNNFTLLGIAYECGFNSKASFNGVFKKFTGLTPSEFKKNLIA